MKILHVGQMIGGLDIYIRNSIVYNKAHNDYIIVCGYRDKHYPVMRDGEAVPEYHISLYRSLNPFKDLKALLQTVKIIKKEKPDIIHCHSAKGGVIGRTAGWLTHTPTCYTPHAFSYLCTSSKLKRKIYWKRYPDEEYIWMCRNIKRGGWLLYEDLEKMKREEKKAKATK